MKKRSFSLQTHLLALLAVALLPILVVGAIATVLGSKQLHEASKLQLQDNAIALADMVDQRFISYAQMLRLQAASQPQAGTRYLPQITTETRTQSELVMMDLLDPVQRAALPSDFLNKLPNSNQITVSDLYQNSPTGPFNIAIGLPSNLTPDLSRFAMLVPSTEILDFTQVSMPEGANGTLMVVVDSQGRIAARTHNQARWLGQIAPNWSKLNALNTRQGLLPIVTAEGDDVIVAFRRLNVAKDWVLVVAEDQQALNATWRVPLRGTLLGLLATVIVSLLLARWASQRILRPLKQVQSSSRAILGMPGTSPAQTLESHVNIREFDELSTNLMRAQSLLQEQTQQAQALAGQLQRNEARHRAMAEVGALVFWQADAKGQLMQLTGWRELTGQQEAQAMGGGWRKHIHPSDLPNLESNALSANSIDTEFRILDVHERWHWVRARGVRISGAQKGQTEWAGVLEDVDARLRAQARIGYLAKYDTLTGLANRSHFKEVLVAAIASAESRAVAVLSMDLDRFMHINDTLGYAVGDELLQRVTVRFLGLLPQDGLLARFGGDEFSMLFKTSAPEAEIEALAQNILAAFQQPFVIESHSINANTCIGAAWSQSSTDSAEDVMRYAQLAMHRAKADGRTQVRLFDPAMELQMQRRRQMEVDLRAGLESAQFCLVYQPLVDLQTLNLVGFEALLRWHHPTMGILTPGRFIHIAEEIGLMEVLGVWVLEQACRDAKNWSDNRLTVAVNIAASQLNAQLEQKVSSVLAATGLAPHRLELEVTENALMTHIEEAAKSLLQLQENGVAIVLDDFGTGYTSLSHLRAFPFNKVKIDKGFVHDLSTMGHEQDGEAIIAAISLLCKRLGIVAVAEGVETAQQMQRVIGFECQQAQGFLFGMPVSQTETCQLIRLWAPQQQRIQDFCLADEGPGGPPASNA